MTANPIVSTVPFDTDGVHHGFLRLPHSRDQSAWGSVMIPLTVVRNGKGKTALLTGANHGDEYEGPVALVDLAKNLQPGAITGTVIIVPFFNTPAFRAGKRTSPIDGGNLNRSFPGAPDGTVTEKIADYFQTTLIPKCDLALDIHSGGKTLEFVPFAAWHILADRQLEAASAAAVQAFNAPYSAKLLEIDNVGMYDTAVEAQGKVFVTTELGGGGTTTARTIAIAKRGVRNLLIHTGILAGKPSADTCVALDLSAPDCFIFSEHQGLIEPIVDLGDDVDEGEVIARIWPIERTGVAPTDYRAPRQGILAGRHFPGMIEAGDCIALVGTVLSEGD